MDDHMKELRKYGGNRVQFLMNHYRLTNGDQLYTTMLEVMQEAYAAGKDALERSTGLHSSAEPPRTGVRSHEKNGGGALTEQQEREAPIGKMIAYEPKRGRKGVVSITAWGPVDMELKNVSRVIEEKLMYDRPAAPVAVPPLTDEQLTMELCKGIDCWYEIEPEDRGDIFTTVRALLSRTVPTQHKEIP